MSDKKLLASLLSQLGSEFASNAHTSQHRLFSFITTNIRTPKSIAKYIVELLPEFINREKDLESWEKWTKNRDVLKKNKQKFKRLEYAKILFRHINKENPNLNDIGKSLYYISKNYGEHYLAFVLNLYLLSGKYFDVEKQPLVEIEKILSVYKIDLENDIKVLVDKEHKKPSKLLLASIFYNPSSTTSIEIAFMLLKNELDYEDLQTLLKLTKKSSNNFIWKKIDNAGGIGNFKSDVAIIINYHIFKQACLKHIEQADYKSILEEYIEQLFQTNLTDKKRQAVFRRASHDSNGKCKILPARY